MQRSGVLDLGRPSSPLLPFSSHLIWMCDWERIRENYFYSAEKLSHMHKQHTHAPSAKCLKLHLSWIFTSFSFQVKTTQLQLFCSGLILMFSTGLTVTSVLVLRSSKPSSGGPWWWGGASFASILAVTVEIISSCGMVQIIDPSWKLLLD